MEQEKDISSGQIKYLIWEKKEPRNYEVNLTTIHWKILRQIIRLCLSARKIAWRQVNETHVYPEKIMSKQSQFLMRKGNRPYEQRRSRWWSYFFTLSYEWAGITLSKRIHCIWRIATSSSLLKLKDVLSRILLNNNRLGLNFHAIGLGGTGSVEKWVVLLAEGKNYFRKVLGEVY